MLQSLVKCGQEHSQGRSRESQVYLANECTLHPSRMFYSAGNKWTSMGWAFPDPCRQIKNLIWSTFNPSCCSKSENTCSQEACASAKFQLPNAKSLWVLSINDCCLLLWPQCIVAGFQFNKLPALASCFCLQLLPCSMCSLRHCWKNKSSYNKTENKGDPFACMSSTDMEGRRELVLCFWNYKTTPKPIGENPNYMTQNTSFNNDVFEIYIISRGSYRQYFQEHQLKK